MIACPGNLALCGVPCGCNGENPSHYPPGTPQSRQLTEHVFTCARAGDFYRAIRRVDEVLEEIRSAAYEAGRAAASKERAA